MGCFFALFGSIAWLLVLLFTSRYPTAKKIGWGIIGILGAIYVLGSAGVSPEGALIIIIAGIVIIIGVCAVRSGKKTDAEHHTENNIAADREHKKTESFDEQLEAVKRQAESVSGKKLRDSRLSGEGIKSDGVKDEK